MSKNCTKLTFKSLKGLVLAAFLVVPFWSTASLAQTTKIACNPQYRQAAIQAGINATKADAATNDSIRNQILTQPSNQLMACVGSYWPNLNLGFPTMDQLAKAAEDYVVNQACNEARQAISKVTNPITSAGGAWGSVPGLNVPGVGGGVTTGNNNGGCVTVNGQQSCSGTSWTGGLNGVL